MATYVVTGCAGFIGSHLSESLVARGDNVIGIDNFSPFYSRELKNYNLSQLKNKKQFTLLNLDIAKDSLNEVISKACGVFHLAAQPGVRTSWGKDFDIYVKNNVCGTQRVFEAASNQQIRVVWASSSSIYGNATVCPTTKSAIPQPISPYGTTKLACEHLSFVYQEAFGLDAIGMRYFTVYGPRQRPDMAFMRITRAILCEKPFTLFGTGEQSRDALYVLDAVKASLLAMEKGSSGAVFNIGGGKKISVKDAIKILEETADKNLQIELSPVEKGDAWATSADTRLAREELGWKPSVSIEEGLQNQFKWASRLHCSS